MEKFLKKVFTNQKFCAMIWASEKKNTRRCIMNKINKELENNEVVAIADKLRRGYEGTTVVAPEPVGRGDLSKVCGSLMNNANFDKQYIEKDPNLKYFDRSLG